MKKKRNIKKIILLCIILANVLFICLKSDTFKAEREYHLARQTEEQVIAKSEDAIVLGENTIIEQEFTPKERKLGKFKIYFNNSMAHESTGEIVFSVLDKEKNVIYSDSLEMTSVKHDSATIFDLSGNTKVINSNHIVNRKTYNASKGIKVDVGETYILQIKAVDVHGTAPLEVILADTDQSVDKALTVDGTVREDEQIHSSAVYFHFTYKVFAALLAILLMAGIVILIPWGKIDEKFADRFKTKTTVSMCMSRMMFVLTPFVCLFINSKIIDVRTSNIILMLFKPKGWLNLLTIGLVWWLIYVICNRVKYTTIVTTIAFGIFAMVNYAMVQFRGLPLMATDLVNVGTAMDVASSYTLSFDKPALWVITITIVWCCVAAAFESYKGVCIKRRIVNVILLGLCFLVFNYTFFGSTYLKDHAIKVSNFNPTGGYKNNGCVLGFMITVTTSRMEKPEAYSMETVEEIMSAYTSDVAGDTEITEHTPNVIYVMNESFADLSIIGDLGLSEDDMPFYRSLEENTIKGHMLVSAFGGQTANTEFEVLTGNTTAFLPYHTVAYSGIIKNEIPSIATSLSDAGYVGNTAFHPGMVDSYNRNTMYPYMGFEEHLSIEDVENPRNIRSFLSDEHNYEILIDDYEDIRKENTDDPYFMFNITIQNHGGYGSATGVVNGDITLNNAELATEGLQQYENLIKLSDDALKELVEYYEEQEEPTVIIFFGDHHPNLTTAMYKKLYDGRDDYYALENYQKRYMVPFMIWTNYDIEEKSGVELSTNYLTAYMKQAIGISMTGYDKFLMDLYEKVPMITGNCYKGDDGKFYSWESDVKSPYTELLEAYRLVQYNGLIDSKNIVKEFFYLSE